jgi:hypothetical protein
MVTSDITMLPRTAVQNPATVGREAAVRVAREPAQTDHAGPHLAMFLIARSMTRLVSGEIVSPK